MWRGLTFILTVLFFIPVILFAQNTATEEFVWLPGAARSIPRTESASRDRPVFEYAYGPAAQTSIGGEWGWFAVKGLENSFRFGMYAMIALENRDSYVFFPPAQVWRGMTGFSGAWSFDAIGKRWFGEKGGFEFGLVAGHESIHGTIDDPIKPGDEPHGGEGQFITPDVAVRISLNKKTTVTSRVQGCIYLNGTLTGTCGADVILRFQVYPAMNLVIALFGEAIEPSDEQARNGYFVRMMTGPAIAGRYGECTFFASVDAGNGKGLLFNHRDVRYSAGARYAPFTER